MKKEFKKKLSLNKEIIENLNGHFLNQIKGGVVYGSDNPPFCKFEPSDGCPPPTGGCVNCETGPCTSVPCSTAPPPLTIYLCY